MDLYRRYCIFGNYSELKNLLEINKTIDIHDKFSILIMIMHNNLECLKYIFNVTFYYSNKPFNLHNDNEIYFICACNFGHIDTIKYLIELSNTLDKINMNIYNNLPYEYACARNNKEIIKYLDSVNDQVQ